jgi:hypothetical protein
MQMHFSGKEKKISPPHPLYKEKKKIKKRKLKKERFLHQVSREPVAVTKPNGLGPRARSILHVLQNGLVRLACKVEVLRAIIEKPST